MSLVGRGGSYSGPPMGAPYGSFAGYSERELRLARIANGTERRASGHWTENVRLSLENAIAVVRVPLWHRPLNDAESAEVERLRGLLRKHVAEYPESMPHNPERVEHHFKLLGEPYVDLSKLESA